MIYLGQRDARIHYSSSPSAHFLSANPNGQGRSRSWSIRSHVLSVDLYFRRRLFFENLWKTSGYNILSNFHLLEHSIVSEAV